MAGGLKPSPFSISMDSPTAALENLSKAGMPKKMNWKMARARVKAILGLEVLMKMNKDRVPLMQDCQVINL